MPYAKQLKSFSKIFKIDSIQSIFCDHTEWNQKLIMEINLENWKNVEIKWHNLKEWMS